MKARSSKNKVCSYQDCKITISNNRKYCSRNCYMKHRSSKAKTKCKNCSRVDCTQDQKECANQGCGERICWKKEYCTPACYHANIHGEGNPNYGNSWSEEQRRHLSEYKKKHCKRGKEHHSYGRKVPEEQKKRQRKSLKKWRKENPKKAQQLDAQIVRVGKSMRGKKLTDKHKRKIGEANRGRTASKETKKILSKKALLRWKSKTPEEKAIFAKKISKSNKGKKFTDEHKRKIGLAHKGKTMSEETKKKMSKSKKGKKLSEKRKKQISKISQRIWDERSTKEKEVILKKTFSKQKNHPNGLEKKALKVIENNGFPLLFVGDGSLFIEGKSPDFIDEENNLIVEVYSPYWKNKNWDSEEKYRVERQEEFTDYKVLFFNTCEVEDGTMASVLSDVYS